MDLKAFLAVCLMALSLPLVYGIAGEDGLCNNCDVNSTLAGLPEGEQSGQMSDLENIVATVENGGGSKKWTKISDEDLEYANDIVCKGTHASDSHCKNAIKDKRVRGQENFSQLGTYLSHPKAKCHDVPSDKKKNRYTPMQYMAYHNSQDCFTYIFKRWERYDLGKEELAKILNKKWEPVYAEHIDKILKKRSNEEDKTISILDYMVMYKINQEFLDLLIKNGAKHSHKDFCFGDKSCEKNLVMDSKAKKK